MPYLRNRIRLITYYIKNIYPFTRFFAVHNNYDNKIIDSNSTCVCKYSRETHGKCQYGEHKGNCTNGSCCGQCYAKDKSIYVQCFAKEHDN